MKKLFDNLVVDLLAAVLILGMLTTGYIIRFPLPPGTNKSLGLWGLTRHSWGTVHSWISVGLLAVILTHVMLHWQWIVVTLRRRFRMNAQESASTRIWRNLLVGFGLIGSFAIFAFMAHLNVKPLEEPADDSCGPIGSGSQMSPTDSRKTEKVSDHSSAEFWKDVYPILESNCVSCHGPKIQLGRFQIDMPQQYFESSNQSALVIAGNSDDSRLVAILSGRIKDFARPDVHRLPEKHIAIIRDWIDSGAKWSTSKNANAVP